MRNEPTRAFRPVAAPLVGALATESTAATGPRQRRNPASLAFIRNRQRAFPYRPAGRDGDGGGSCRGCHGRPESKKTDLAGLEAYLDRGDALLVTAADGRALIAVRADRPMVPASHAEDPHGAGGPGNPRPRLPVSHRAGSGTQKTTWSSKGTAIRCWSPRPWPKWPPTRPGASAPPPN